MLRSMLRNPVLVCLTLLAVVVVTAAVEAVMILSPARGRVTR